MKASYYVGVHTGQNFSPQDYTEKAGILLNIVLDVLNSEEHIAAIVRGTAATVHTELEVSLEQYDASDWQPGEGGWELVLKAVIDLEGTGRLQLDKGKLSNMLRSHEANEWGQSLKIEKKAVPKEAVAGPTEDP
jgi:hypothetical protein|mmetsp:Transcript_27528/g.72746  ORF Transcript_27528/g.72746 Transcript_27528/m.72746 type:complete len:134 (-) Transcript_27528:321-722(-)